METASKEIASRAYIKSHLFRSSDSFHRLNFLNKLEGHEENGILLECEKASREERTGMERERGGREKEKRRELES